MLRQKWENRTVPISHKTIIKENDMISEQKLKEVCENYKIDFKKLIDSNPNILEFGDYTEICYVLDYLRLNVGIMPSNIEKCPSILYRNVSNIKSNYEFLKSKRINIKEIESCLHVLSSDSQQLKDTFKYVKQNYGLKSIERITSILAVAVDIIKSVENLNIGFKNKIGNLSVAVGIGFGFTTLEKVQAILNSEEYKAHPELFTSQTLAHSNIEKIQAILSSEEYKAHPELFTSTTLAHSNIEDISELLKQDYWRDERYKGLLTSTILSRSKSMLKKLPILFKMAEYFNIDDKLNTTFLLKSPSQIYALIKLLEERHESLIVNGKLNAKFGYQPGILLNTYEIDLKEGIKKYPFDETILDKKDGFKDCTGDDKTRISYISGIMPETSEARIDNRGIGDE